MILSGRIVLVAVSLFNAFILVCIFKVKYSGRTNFLKIFDANIQKILFFQIKFIISCSITKVLYLFINILMS